MFKGKCWSVRAREENTNHPRRRERLPQGRQDGRTASALGLTPLLLPEEAEGLLWGHAGGMGKAGHRAQGWAFWLSPAQGVQDQRVPPSC